ncbi:MAG: hypothetical protein KME54_17655 [Tolypothrix brevis GSE-NOS-MK-07-07A]|jgi:hypothetical protein|nr:hypothetical protein [Tolypothrix brevis GSE-NOS-MK-07-07A]
MELSREQEFKICSFNQQVKYLTEIEVKQKLVEMYQRMIILQNHYQREIKKTWLINDVGK